MYNKRFQNLVLFCLFLINYLTVNAQQVHQSVPNEQLLRKQWNAKWITGASGSTYDYGVYHFRKTIEIESIPDSFIINVSGDQRYELFINGNRVSRGPATGDILHWYYETINIVSFLTKGKNIVSATVWHYGIWSPGAQISQQLGLIVQGNSKTEEIVNTNNSWKTMKDASYTPSTKYVQDVGPGDVIDGRIYSWNWNQKDYNDQSWLPVVEGYFGTPRLTSTQYIRALIPRDIPLMESSLLFLNTVRRSSGVIVSDKFLKGDSAIMIPPHKKATILFDQGYLTNSYPTFQFSKGRDAKVSVIYSEGMYLDKSVKGNRNEIDGESIIGKIDSFYIDGGMNRKYSSLWFRTYRYNEVTIETSDEPLFFNSIIGEYTGYPFKEKAVFSSSDSSLKKIWEVGWRTAKLCAGETYYDCPYYEQLQYTGDTRIQALISLYVSGDDRLMRKAINCISWSRTADGILRSRYPARYDQIIPPFSLYWINMVHDYWMHRTDDIFIKSHLSTVKTIVDWYVDKIDPKTGMLGAMPHWNFTDWAKEWPWKNDLPLGGVAPGGMTGGSSILSLQLAYTLMDAIDLMNAFGEKYEAEKYTRLRVAINKSVKEHCYNKTRGLYADNIGQTSYSQHASIMGILSGSLTPQEGLSTFNNLLLDKSLIQATVYYKFYLFRAMKKVGLADKYLNNLETWHNMIANGLTTFAEKPEPSRSDCHAWSASPMYDLLATVCGIVPASPGFKTIRIAPALGNLTFVKGIVPHPQGNIIVELKKEGNRLVGLIILPKGTTGIYSYEKNQIQLKQGNNYLK